MRNQPLLDELRVHLEASAAYRVAKQQSKPMPVLVYFPRETERTARFERQEKNSAR